MTEQAAPPKLLGFQRKFLRGLAHSYRAVVQVGQEGVTTAVVAAVRQALQDHELVKVRLHRPKDKKAMAQQLATRTDAELCGLVGHQAILYRPRAEDPTIEVPSR